MPGHRYPRRFRHSSGFGDKTDYIEITRPGGGWVLVFKNGFRGEESVINHERVCEAYCSRGDWIELFDHHDEEALKIEAEFEQRQAVVYLKSVVKTQKAENEKLRNLLKRALFSSNRAQKRAMIKECRELLGEEK